MYVISASFSSFLSIQKHRITFSGCLSCRVVYTQLVISDIVFPTWGLHWMRYRDMSKLLSQIKSSFLPVLGRHCEQTILRMRITLSLRQILCFDNEDRRNYIHSEKTKKKRKEKKRKWLQKCYHTKVKLRITITCTLVGSEMSRDTSKVIPPSTETIIDTGSTKILLKRASFQLQSTILKGTLGVVVIVVRNGHSDLSSNPGRGCLHFTQR